MKTLSIDIETYSDVPLQKTGVYRYVESPDFEILLFAYSVDNQPVQVIDLACGEQISIEWLKLRSALTTILVTQPLTSNPQPKPYRYSPVLNFSPIRPKSRYVSI